MPQGNDFTPMDAVIQSRTVAWDFSRSLWHGVTLTGTPTVTVSVVSGTDDSPQSRLLGSPVVGSAPGQLSRANCAVIAQIGNLVAGVTYLFVVDCPATNGDVEPLWNHVLAKSPQ